MIEVISKLALAHSAARAAYCRAFTDYEANTLETLDDDKFWELLDKYRTILLGRISRPNNTELAADEFFRQAADTVNCDCGYTHLEAMQFAKTYDEKKGALYKPLFETVTDRGDDGYGDLIDSLPLLGQAAYKMLVGDGERSGYGNNTAFTNAVKQRCELFVRELWEGPNKPYKIREEKIVAAVVEFQNHVLQGENYNCTKLSEEGRRRFVFYAISVERRDKEEAAETEFDYQDLNAFDTEHDEYC